MISLLSTKGRRALEKLEGLAGGPLELERTIGKVRGKLGRAPTGRELVLFFLHRQRLRLERGWEEGVREWRRRVFCPETSTKVDRREP